MPEPTSVEQQDGIYDKTTRGLRIYLATPRLRGLLALNLSVAAAGAMVIVNTVVLVQGLVGKGQADVALALACFGGGSIATALVLPRVPDKIPDRRVMLLAALPLGGVLLAFAGVLVGVGWFNVRTSTTVASGLVWPALCVVWAMLGLGYSSVLTPTGRLLRRSAQPSDRPALFAAQFALSHLCWLVTYPLAGWLGAAAGMEVTLGMLGGLTLIGAILSASFWPAHDPGIVEHYHEDLMPNHPHLAQAHDHRHAHAFVIDHLHPRWPRLQTHAA